MTNQQTNFTRQFQRLKEENKAIQRELFSPYQNNNRSNNSHAMINQIQNLKSQIPRSIPLAKPKETSKYKPSAEVLEEFRSLIQKTSQLTSNGLNIPLSSNQNQNICLNQPINALESDDSLQIDDDFDVTNSDISNENDLNAFENGIDVNNTNAYQAQSSSIQSQTPELDKLKLTNQILTRSNTDLNNANKILDIELSSYESNPLYSNNNIMTSSQYDENLTKFILNVKSSLVQSIKSNLQLKEMIAEILNENEKLTNDNISYCKEHSKMRNDLEYTNRKNAEIQIANEDNTKTLIYLEEENQKSKEQLISIQNEYEELKNAEENMTLINESNKKRKQDNDDLVHQLKATIENLFRECTASNRRKEHSEREIEDSGRSINECLYSIQEIEDEINKRKEENDMIESEIDKKKKMLLEKEDAINGINVQVDKIKAEVDSAKKENEVLKGIAKEKEDIIKNMKDQITSMTNSLQRNFKTNVDDVGENNTNAIDEKILITKKENEQKDNEIEEVTAKYEAIVKQKDDIINNLGMMVSNKQ